MAAPKLVLHPADPLAFPVSGRGPAALLRHIGLLGNSFELDGELHYFAGDRFLSLVTFLGCAPAIQTTPPTRADEVVDAARTGRFCHIVISDTLAAPRIRADLRSRARCPVCRKVQTWSKADPVDATGITLTCAHCRTDSPAVKWSWRQTGGMARLFVDIWGIYPSEAVPSDLLLHTLAKVTGSPWTCFYSTR